MSISRREVMEGIGETATECEKRKYGGRKRGAVGKGN